jgi:hypothetical protein
VTLAGLGLGFAWAVRVRPPTHAWARRGGLAMGDLEPPLGSCFLSFSFRFVSFSGSFSFHFRFLSFSFIFLIFFFSLVHFAERSSPLRLLLAPVCPRPLVAFVCPTCASVTGDEGGRRAPPSFPTSFVLVRPSFVRRLSPAASLAASGSSFSRLPPVCPSSLVSHAFVLMPFSFPPLPGARRLPLALKLIDYR